MRVLDELADARRQGGAAKATEAEPRPDPGPPAD